MEFIEGAVVGWIQGKLVEQVESFIQDVKNNGILDGIRARFRVNDIPPEMYEYANQDPDLNRWLANKQVEITRTNASKYYGEDPVKRHQEMLAKYAIGSTRNDLAKQATGIPSGIKLPAALPEANIPEDYAVRKKRRRPRRIIYEDDEDEDEEDTSYEGYRTSGRR